MKFKLSMLALTAALVTTPALAGKPSQIVVFGDSLVDAGNINAAFGSDFFNPVARGYFPGRFTNGPDYTDLLNQRFYGSLMAPSLLGGTNFAFGGARYVNHGDPVPDMALQLGSYFATTGGAADPKALYILNFGGNDVFGLESGSIGGFASNDLYTAALLDTLSGGIQALSAAGASRILVTGIPNSTPTGFGLEALVQARLNLIEPTLGSTELLRFSYILGFNNIFSNPAAFGLPPFTQPGTCIDNRMPVNGVIDCAGFFSFDGIHPTAAVQRGIYKQVLATVGDVPEPHSWTMMIAGFGLVGAAMRRRTRTQLAA
jgi:phospholipase/lecithinase/hemolysin